MIILNWIPVIISVCIGLTFLILFSILNGEEKE